MFEGVIGCVLAIGLKNKTLSLTTTRIDMNYEIHKDRISLIAILLGLITYIPCWLLSQKIANLVAKIWTKYQAITLIRYGTFIGVGMFTLVLIIAGHVVYVLNPTIGYFQSLLLSLFIVIVIWAFANSRK